MLGIKHTCQFMVGFVSSLMALGAGVSGLTIALLGNWLPSSITMCAAAWMMSVSETAFDRMLARRLTR